MAASTVLDYILIDGLRYKVDRDKFKRSFVANESSQIVASRVQPPFLDATVNGFESGENLKTMDGTASGYRSGYGLEPVDDPVSSGHLKLKVGRQFVEIRMEATTSGFRAAQIFSNNIFFATGAGATKLIRFDGTTWTAFDWSATVNSPFTEGGRIVRYLESGTNEIIAFGLENGAVLRFNGATFAIVRAAGAGTRGARVVGVGLDPSELVILIDDVTNQMGTVVIRKTAGSTERTIIKMHEPWNLVGAVVQGTVYAFGGQWNDTRQAHCRLYSNAVSVADATNQKIEAEMSDNFPSSAIEHVGKLHVGMTWGGSVRRYDGGGLFTEILHWGPAAAPATIPSNERILAMFSSGTELYVGGYNSAGDSGAQLEVRRLHRGGWHLIARAGNATNDTAVGCIAMFQQNLVIGNYEGTNGRIYQQGNSVRLIAAKLECPDVLFGSPGIPFRWRAVGLRHAALLSGQAVEAKYILNDGTETSVVINRNIGSTETVAWLPESLRGARLRPVFYLTNLSNIDLTIHGAWVRALPAPTLVESWESQLILRDVGTWVDSTVDGVDATTKFDTLATLRRNGSTFQVVAPTRNGTTPTSAMLAAFDPLVPLDGALKELKPNIDIALPIRLLQAKQPENLILNSSFEQDVVGNNPGSWSVFGTPGGWTVVSDSGASQLADAAATGVQALQVSASGLAGDQGVLQNITGGVLKGRVYTVSVYVKRTMTQGTFYVVFWENGVQNWTTSLPSATDTAYQRITLTFQVQTTTTATLYLYVSTPGTFSGSFRVDGVQVEEGAPVSAFRERGKGD